MKFVLLFFNFLSISFQPQHQCHVLAAAKLCKPHFRKPLYLIPAQQLFCRKLQLCHREQIEAYLLKCLYEKYVPVFLFITAPLTSKIMTMTSSTPTLQPTTIMTSRSNPTNPTSAAFVSKEARYIVSFLKIIVWLLFF